MPVPEGLINDLIDYIGGENPDKEWTVLADLLRRTWTDYDTQGFALAKDTEFCDLSFRRQMIEHFFPYLERERYPEVAFPPDRHRACDTLGRTRYHGRLVLVVDSRLQTAPGVLGNHPHGLVRDYPRVMLQAHKFSSDWIEDLLYIIPPWAIPEKVKIRVDLFASEATVGASGKLVAGAHSDGSLVTIMYVVEKLGTGAITRLHDPVTKEIVHEFELMPGDHAFIDGERWLHSVTDLIPGHYRWGRRRLVVVNLFD